jgi:hypothetical protein
MANEDSVTFSAGLEKWSPASENRRDDATIYTTVDSVWKYGFGSIAVLQAQPHHSNRPLFRSKTRLARRLECAGMT